MERTDYPSMSICGLIYVHLYQHLEQYILDPKRKLTGVDPATGLVFPEWIQRAAKCAYEKLDKYYPSSDGLVYIISTGNIQSSILVLNQLIITQFQ